MRDEGGLNLPLATGSFAYDVLTGSADVRESLVSFRTQSPASCSSDIALTRENRATRMASDAFEPAMLYVTTFFRLLQIRSKGEASEERAEDDGLVTQ